VVALLTKGRVLETILNAEQGVASCGSGSQSLPREVRKAAAGHYDPVRGARSNRPGSNSGLGKARHRSQKPPRWSAGRRASSEGRKAPR